MKKIEAIIRPMRLEEVKAALQDIGLPGLTVIDVRGFGRQQGRTEKYRGSTYTVNLLPKLKVEVVVPDDRLEEAMETLAEAARTGEIGDGKIFVSEIEDVVRIRTGDRGEIAL
ncbi:MAG: P-II family nitrogen regulator [bacterium]|jgi:nitrogen regulatory protein PII